MSYNQPERSRKWDLHLVELAGVTRRQKFSEEMGVLRKGNQFRLCVGRHVQTGYIPTLRIHLSGRRCTPHQNRRDDTLRWCVAADAKLGRWFIDTFRVISKLPALTLHIESEISRYQNTQGPSQVHLEGTVRYRVNLHRTNLPGNAPWCVMHPQNLSRKTHVSLL